MKQGTGKSIMGAGKVEPQSSGINVQHVAGIGLQKVHTKSVPESTGRGFRAAPIKSMLHKHGSQGNH